jgi:single-strand DNA-binding protein
MNKVIIVGRLGSDPDLKYTASGTAIVNMSVATSDVWKDKDGNKQESTEWHRVTVWDKQAEHCNMYLRKGSQVLVDSLRNL